jgi:hypothetical protein
MLDNKYKYAEVYTKYKRMPINKLQEEVKDLFHKRYNDQDLDSIELHRIASAVYQRRTRSGTGLIFHLNKFVR